MPANVGVPNIVPVINPVRATITWETMPRRFRTVNLGYEQRSRSYGLWSLTYEWEALEQDQAQGVIAVFNKYGLDTSFTIYDITRPATTGIDQTSLANIHVNGINQTGQSLIVDLGMGTPPSNGTIVFRAGDIIGLANKGQVFEITADAVSNGTNALTLSLAQFIRNSPDNAEPVITSYVPFKVRLEQPVRATITDSPPQYTFSVEMKEAL